MRKSWDEYFMEIAEIVKTRSTCLRRQVAAAVNGSGCIFPRDSGMSFAAHCMRSRTPSFRRRRWV